MQSGSIAELALDRVAKAEDAGTFVLFGLQHVLVMAVSPLYQLWRAGRWTLSLALLSTTFLTCGFGSVV